MLIFVITFLVAIIPMLTFIWFIWLNVNHWVPFETVLISKHPRNIMAQNLKWCLRNRFVYRAGIAAYRKKNNWCVAKIVDTERWFEFIRWLIINWRSDLSSRFNDQLTKSVFTLALVYQHRCFRLLCTDICKQYLIGLSIRSQYSSRPSVFSIRYIEEESMESVVLIRLCSDMYQLESNSLRYKLVKGWSTKDTYWIPVQW